MSHTNFELAGFVDDDGNLGRQLQAASRIVIPEEVWLAGDAIRWRKGKRPTLQDVSRQMLDQFVALSDAESILRFAKRWGVLALSGGQESLPCREFIREGVEPITAWQYYSRRARAVLNIAASLKQNKLGDLDDWKEIAWFPPASGTRSERDDSRKAAQDHHRWGLGVAQFGPMRLDLECARGLIACDIQMWLDCWKPEKTFGISDLAFYWIPGQKRWNIALSYHECLFAAIALQLALVIADADNLYSCSGCGIPYVRSRERKRPKSGCANYCDRCAKKGLAQRTAVKNYREKKSTAVRLQLSGVPVQEIARQLKTEVARVRGWLIKDKKDAQAKQRK